MNDNNLLQAIGTLTQDLRMLQDRAFNQYSSLVGQVISGQITDKQDIEKIMDGILDFCDEDRFINIYRQLCRHIYYQYPQLVGEHIALFRAQFETNDVETEVDSI